MPKRQPLVLTIEDDDGFTTHWPAPKDRLLLGSGDYVALCENMHDEMRKKWLKRKRKGSRP